MYYFHSGQKKEFADLCALDEWKGCKPRKIELDDFLEEWLPEMKIDGIKTSIFPNHKDSIILDIEKLIYYLKEEMENY